MEELRTTEALDREILEDARKKADRILKTAGQTIQSIEQQWKDKLRHAIEELEQTYRHRTEKAVQEIMARLPLDKRRARSEWAERMIQRATESFCSALPRDNVLSLMEAELSKRLQVITEFQQISDSKEDMVITITGLTRAEADLILKKPFLQGAWIYSDASHWDDSVLYPDIICDNSSLRLVVSFKAVIDQLLLDKRAELAVALLGKGVTND